MKSWKCTKICDRLILNDLLFVYLNYNKDECIVGSIIATMVTLGMSIMRIQS